MKRKISRLTSIAILLSLSASLSACGSAGTDKPVSTTAPTTTAEEVKPLTDELPERDMNGFEFTIFTPSDAALGWALRAIDVEETTGDLIYDEIYNRNRRTEERFNCVIREEQQSSNQPDNLINSVLAGEDTYKIGQINDETLNKVNTSGVLSTWDKLPYVNLDAEWWNSSANEMFVLGGKQYAAIGDFNLAEYSKSYLLFFNKDIYSEIKQDKTVYEMVMDGTWTFEAMLSTAKQYARDLNGDTEMTDADRFGYAACSKVGMTMLIEGAGVKFVDTADNGNPVFAIPGNEAALSKMQKILSAFSSASDWYYNAPDSYGGMQDTLFINGKVLFQAASIWQTEQYRSLEFDIGLLPAPKYDEAQEDYHSVAVGGLITVVPKSLGEADLENTSIILEALSFDSRQNLLPLYKETVLQTKYARDDESSKVIDIIFNSQTFDTGLIVWTDARKAYMNGPFYQFTDTLVSTTDSVKPKMEAAIQASIDALSEQ